MKNPWLLYTLARLVVFAAILTILLLVGFNGYYSVAIAAVLSLAFSLIFLNKQRQALSQSIYNKVQKNKVDGIDDADSDLENDILDRS
jgi:hypothetical protein